TERTSAPAALRRSANIDSTRSPPGMSPEPESIETMLFNKSSAPARLASTARYTDSSRLPAALATPARKARLVTAMTVLILLLTCAPYSDPSSHHHSAPLLLVSSATAAT